MKKRFRNYKEVLHNNLRDDESAYLYLKEALKDEDPTVFLLALKDVFEAQELKMTDVAQQANLSRENLYRILSKKGNPKLNNFKSILNAVGYQLSLEPLKR